MLGIPRGGKEKVLIEITIHHLTKLPKSGSILYVLWERFKKFKIKKNSEEKKILEKQ
jgi:hypothetical protein